SIESVDQSSSAAACNSAAVACVRGNVHVMWACSFKTLLPYRSGSINSATYIKCSVWQDR
ncbi:hypothetical protein, partial [Pseudomonas viridiflava]|uniref:hypothetical protein n=1 Tax=Pseudomonas viridiflava TaxID=33069 RepID=UPI00197CFEAE